MSRYGLSIWSSPDQAESDIVFVHGLRGHREQTWTKDGVLWPRDLLAPDLKKCRIMSFGYDSAIVHSDTAEVTQGSLATVARSLCSSLSTERSAPEIAGRPILLVAHSLGGLVCATAVVLGDRNAAGDNVEVIAQCIKGIIFLGTPFGGSNLAKWAELVRRIFDTMKKTDQTTLKSLHQNSHELKDLGSAFSDVVRKRNNGQNKIKIVFFYEELDTYGQRVVEEKSASYPGLGETLPLRSNHLNMCKFASKDENEYKIVRAKILELVSDKNKNTVAVKPFSTTFNNYDQVINQSGGDMNIGQQSFQF
ncbi:hypothetical protein N7510_007326 [Penicillium lagena]|uniref:uncharacterized protein n=1 Tax=Penicillium lagena TaxID=94218 RepID=UPI0025412E0C|nr:uncharacterized protein N7510_007326 [Penicillium lagena]KAJ5610607.1 hypothetical protein N7510_007326 [Penicillium lagena]